MIRRSDDALFYDCVTVDGRMTAGSLRSEMEGGKMAASVVFWDLGITDSITDKHRTYQGNFVIPVQPRQATLESTVETVQPNMMPQVQTSTPHAGVVERGN